MWQQIGGRQSGKSIAAGWCSSLAGTRRHSEQYDKLSIEEKLLVDDDMIYLEDRFGNKISFEIYRSMIEKVVIELFKRGEKNGERNGR